MLGPDYQPQQTTFRVFAQAPAVVLNLYQPTRHLKMRPKAGGLWEITVRGDLKDRQYTYTANGHEVIDPYARRVTAHDGRGVVSVDHTPIAPRPKFAKQDSVIYELHLRDFTPDGKYTSLQAKIPHLLELGVNTVQILPLCEFANGDQYGWGYDSVHFNAPETSYGRQNPVRELKQMIDSLHKANLKVVMDMVYNHTMENHQRIYSFQGLAPNYYYRMKSPREFWNGSGVGNEFNSEAPMARQFIKDSLKIWVNEYQVDGFRFDLMGLIDKQTLCQIRQELPPEILIYGEPWAAGPTPIKVTGKGDQEGWAVFNDDFRDALKGSVFRPTEGGYVQLNTNLDKVKQGLMGSIDTFARSPLEVINYVECHDNHTLADRLTLSAPQATPQERLQMNRLAAVAVFTAQGIPFIQAGQEFARSKQLEDNTYNLGDAVNKIRWQDKRTQQDLFDYYRGLIALRKAHPVFRQTSAAQIRASLSFTDPPISLCLQNQPGDSWKRARVLFNARPVAQVYPLEPGPWQVYVNATQAGPTPLQEVHDRVELPPRSALVLAQKEL